ncbi:hypothetical protein CCR75_003492 [Bremia lactucae]|uniref:Uncharacterized protein n=1 Tax=Bremia lactucae TaxID=4779 RepID=A0A976FS15_BRELC|nr:hypothetical protein CCR75_003492 [Bremia lactucae]
MPSESPSEWQIGALLLRVIEIEDEVSLRHSSCLRDNGAVVIDRHKIVIVVSALNGIGKLVRRRNMFVA